MKEYISRCYGNIIHIYDPIYRENIWVLISPDKKDYFKVYKQHFGKDAPDIDYDHIQARYSVGEKEQDKEKFQIHLIWLKKFTIHHLVHELLHCVGYILRQKETYLSEHTDEVYAYYMEFLVKEILKYRRSPK